jgi:hypothetical protein
MKAFVPGRPYWWQWPVILSLDAPAVAVVWQWQLARVAGVQPTRHHAFILGAAVWLAYAADRWIEGWRLAPGQVQTQRHHFYQRWRWPVAAVWLGLLAATLTVSMRQLTGREFAAGLLLLGPVLAYLLSHQLAHRDSPWRAPKELCVALLLAGGVSCFTLAQVSARISELGVPLALFTLLCLANCALISLWEHEVDRSHGQTSLALQYPGGRRVLHLLPWLVAAFATGFAARETGSLQTATLAAAASGVLLGLVDWLHLRCGRQLARVLADVALMTPLAPWLLVLLAAS